MAPRYLYEIVTMTVAEGHRALNGNPALARALFGPVDWHTDGKSSKTYALLDAARLFGLKELLEGSGLIFECLFTAEAAEELGDVAPYLVQLQPDCNLTRALLSGVTKGGPPWEMWPLGGASFLRSDMEISALRRHFRKFTRLFDDSTGRWNFFRFYAPEVMMSIVANMEPEGFRSFTKGIDLLAIPQGTDRMAILADVPPDRSACSGDVRGF